MQDKSGKLHKLIEKIRDPEQRKELLKGVKHNIRGFIALTTLIAFLMTPAVGRAEAPLEFRTHSSAQMDRVYSYDREVLEEWALESGLSQEELNDILYVLYSEYDEDEDVTHKQLRLYNQNYQNIELDEGETIIDDSTNALNESYNFGIYVGTPLPSEVQKQIADLDTATIYDVPQEVIKNVRNKQFEIFDLENAHRKGDYPEYEIADFSSYSGDLSELGEHQLVYMSLEQFRGSGIHERLKNNCKICLSIDDYASLTTQEAESMRGIVDFVRLNPSTNQGYREATEVYSLEEYIETSKKIDEIVALVDTDAPQITQIAQAYFEIGLITNYKQTMGANGVRRKECGNARGALVEKKTVCIGYAEALRAIANRLGFKARIYSGSQTPEDPGHAICEIFIEEQGKWAQFDVTWDAGAIKHGTLDEVNSFAELLYSFPIPHDQYEHSTDDLYTMQHSEVVKLFSEIAKRRWDLDKSSSISLAEIREFLRSYDKRKMDDILWGSILERLGLEEVSPGYFGDEYEADAPIPREQASEEPHTPSEDVDDREDFDYR